MAMNSREDHATTSRSPTQMKTQHLGELAATKLRSSSPTTTTSREEQRNMHVVDLEHAKLLSESLQRSSPSPSSTLEAYRRSSNSCPALRQNAKRDELTTLLS
jgi:hypothetical protein